jgi:RecA-family ATPase
VIDTLNRAISAGGVDENSNSDMGRVLSLLERLCDEAGCAVLFAHHVSEGMASSGRTAEQRAARGAGVITDNARWQANLSPTENPEEIQLEVTKANYGPKPAARLLRKTRAGALVGPKFVTSLRRLRETHAEVGQAASTIENWDDDV